MKRKYRIFSLQVVFCLLIACKSIAWQAPVNKIDSIKNVIGGDKIDNSNLVNYRKVGSYYAAQGKMDSSEFFYKAGLQKSKQLKNINWTAKFTLWVGGIYIVQTRYDSAVFYLNSSLPIIQQLKSDSLLAQYYQNYGSLFLYQNNYDDAIDYTLKAVEILERMGNKRPPGLLMPAYSNLSAVFNSSKQHQKSLEYDKKAISIKSDLLDSGTYAALYFNCAVTYQLLHDSINLKKYLDTAKIFDDQYPNPQNTLNIRGGFGSYYEAMHKYDSALHYYEQAIRIGKESDLRYFLPENEINAANILFRFNRLAEAKILLEDAVAIGKEFQDYKMISEGYSSLKKIALKKGEFKEAVSHEEYSRLYADSLTNSETQNTILTLETKYENQKKEKEITSLKISQSEKELLIVKRNRLMIAGSISAISLISILGLLYRSSKQKQVISEKEKILQQQQIGFLEKQQQVVSMQSMINGQETERTRIAKDLHDGLGGLFSTVKMYFSSLQHEIKDLDKNELFQKSINLVTDASNEVRRIAHNMMPEALLKLGLTNAVKDLCDSISAGKLLKVTLEVHGMNKRLSASTEIMLYRILQELLNNIMKHAQATEVIIQFVKDNSRLSIVVEDNGRGFSAGDAENGTHTGIDTIQSRVNYLNGKLTIDSQKNMGTTVMMDFLIDE